MLASLRYIRQLSLFSLSRFAFSPLMSFSRHAADTFRRHYFAAISLLIASDFDSSPHASPLL